MTKGIVFKHITVREDIFDKFLRFGVYRETYSDKLNKIMQKAEQNEVQK